MDALVYARGSFSGIGSGLLQFSLVMTFSKPWSVSSEGQQLRTASGCEPPYSCVCYDHGIVIFRLDLMATPLRERCVVGISSS